MSDPNQSSSPIPDLTKGQAKNLQTLEDYFKAKSASSKAQEELVSLENVSHESIRERCRVDLNFYAGLIIPRVMRVPFPAFYCQLFTLLTQLNPDPYELMRFALGLPRGFVKTGFLKILTCWFIHFGYAEFILIVCASEPKAVAFITDVDNMLSQPNIEEIFGLWSATKSVDNAKKKVGTINGKVVILLPAGAGTAVRGTNEDHKRPDLIVCDDVQTRECALSEVQNAALLEWFTATLVKCIDNYGSNRRIIYLGNMYPGDCILQMLRKNPEWISLVTGAILEDGESLWPELKPVSVLIREYVHDEALGLGHIWFAEVQNDPLDSIFKLLDKPIPDVPFDWENMEADAAFITVDPAGFRKKSDHNVATLHKLYDGNPVAVQMQGGIWTPKETVYNVIRMALDNAVCIIGIESTGYQQSLCYWMNEFLQAAGITWINVVELKTKNKTKLNRIQDYIKEVLGGDSFMSPKVRSVFSFYAGLYKIGKTDNRDDYLDSPAYQKQILTDYGNLLVGVKNVQQSLDQLPPIVDVGIGEMENGY
ncbi:p07 [Pseudomonas phage PaP2]|uniref:putative head assembly cofactor n=1 Tax=Pseudomonas phage PaP2 TaxID=270673 RepID=UPI00003593BB|nr:putative head assembly cofactor [Pseudomonas phage PaP2]AAS89593.1 p07 [Pseudomonas phage PaP2]